MQETIPTMLEANQQKEEIIIQSEEPIEHNVRRSTRKRNDSTRLAGYKRFPYQSININFYLIE